MFLVKILVFFFIIIFKELMFSDGAWAWGPAIHTAISCNILEVCARILPAVASVIQSFPNEYIYGAISADFFIGRRPIRIKGHSHNWETGFMILDEANSDKEAAYAYGFLSHLAADIVAHNYFVPDLIRSALIGKRIGHVYSEAIADRVLDPEYLKIARNVLSMDHLDYDKQLRSSAVRKRFLDSGQRNIYLSNR